MAVWHIIHADVLKGLAMLPKSSIHCVVTSPPYWSLRNYGMPGQIGSEATFDEHIDVLIRVFEEIWRVLRPDGTCYLNYGDCFVGANNKGRKGVQLVSRGIYDPSQGARASYRELPRKSLIGMPWRVVFALQTMGWILRSDIVVDKPNAMPDSAKDRPGRCHEFMFLLTKQQTYYYDRDAVRVPTTGNTHSRSKGGVDSPKCQRRHYTAPGQTSQTGLAAARHRNNSSFASAVRGNHDSSTRNLRDVWTISNYPYSGGHFATFSPKLVEPCVLAGCPKGGIVLDPFVGSGTTICVALEQGRRGLGIELNGDYIKMAETRILASLRKQEKKK